VNRIYLYSFGIGIAMTACAGCFLITFYFTQPLMGSMFDVISFIIGVLGLGSIAGALVGYVGRCPREGHKSAQALFDHASSFASP